VRTLVFAAFLAFLSYGTLGSLPDPTSLAALVVGLAVGVGEMGVVVASQVRSCVSCWVRGSLSCRAQFVITFSLVMNPSSSSQAVTRHLLPPAYSISRTARSCQLTPQRPPKLSRGTF
jgi:hypothetical protein